MIKSTNLLSGRNDLGGNDLWAKQLGDETTCGRNDCQSHGMKVNITALSMYQN